MKRVIVGPFNRVEGDLEVALDIEGGRIEEARVTSPLYRGFEQILLGRPAADALVIAPRICGICSVSQSVAAAAALRSHDGVKPAPNGVLATNIAHAAENIADHLTHFYVFFMPDFARADYAGRPWFDAIETRFKATRGTAAAQVLPARARLLHVMGILAGKWPHSLAFRPGGTTRAIDLGERIKLVAVLADFRSFLEEHLFAAPLEEVLALEDGSALAAFADGPAAGGDFAAFIRIARDLKLDRAGMGPGPLMSFGAYHLGDGTLFAPGLQTAMGGAITPVPADDIREDVSHAWMQDTPGEPLHAETLPDAYKPGAYSWAKAPRLQGGPVEVGALARQAVDGLPLIANLLREAGGSNVMARVVARLVEIARLVLAMEQWSRDLRLKEPFHHDAPSRSEGDGVGLVEAARGSLGHWFSTRNGRITGYQIIAPTTWNFSPRDANGVPGPVESALAGLEVGAAGARSPMVQHVIRSFDPCMVCTAH